MSDVSCPHCDAPNEFENQFCTACGKAMPGLQGGPNIVEGGGLASTQAGQELQADELQKKVRGAAAALLAVSILATIAIFLIPAMINSEVDSMKRKGYIIDYKAVDQAINIARISQIVYAGCFFGLFLWARKSPFPAAIVGLILFVSVWVVMGVMDPKQFVSGILIKIIVVAVLVKAIQAGSQYRQLKQQMGD